MRLAICALSAVLLSGCSWLPWGGNGGWGAQSQSIRYQGQSQGQYQGRTVQQNAIARCQVQAPTQPIPYGCDPASVTLATSGTGQSRASYNQFPQQPQFGAQYNPGQYTTGQYGNHVDVANQQGANYKGQKRLRKPKLRGSLGLGFEDSINGDNLSSEQILGISQNFFPNTLNAATLGSVASGQTIDQSVDFLSQDITAPSISIGDTHRTPLNIHGGVEYIFSPRTTAFLNAGYNYSNGESETFVAVDGTADITTTTTSFDPAGAVTGTTSTTSFAPPVTAQLGFDFSNLNRVDLEGGVRHYFNPIWADKTRTTITPFVSASGGASRINEQSVEVSIQGLTGVPGNIDIPDTQDVILSESQWVPSATGLVGVEWQATPKTAIAFETGLRFEGRRDLIDGFETGRNLSIPVRIRGSYNF